MKMEIIIEEAVYGRYRRVSAIDKETGFEVWVSGPSDMTARMSLVSMAKRKLERSIYKDRQ